MRIQLHYRQPGRYLTEDWSFCRRWRELGGTIWADTSIKLVHVGYSDSHPRHGANLEKVNIKIDVGIITHP